MKPCYKKLFWTLVIITDILFNPVTLVIAWFCRGASWVNHGQYYRKPTFQLELTKTQIYSQPSHSYISDIQQVSSAIEPSKGVTWIVGIDRAVAVDAMWRKQSQVR